MTTLLSPFVCLGLLKCSATWLRNLNPRAQHVHRELHFVLEQRTRTWCQSSKLQESAIKCKPFCGPDPATGWTILHEHQSAKSVLLKCGQSKSVFEEYKICVHACCWERSSMFRKLTISCSYALRVEEGCRILKEICKKCFFIISGW